MPDSFVRRFVAHVAAIEFGDPCRALDVLFLHANGFTALTYAAVLAPLAAEMRILALDLRGHGRTTLPTALDSYTWQIFADDVLACLAALGEPPRILSGHSMGGTTALLAAPRLVEHTPRLVLFDPVIAPAAAYAVPDPKPDLPLVQGALRRKPHFASREEAFLAYRGRGAFATWPDEALRDYVTDGLKPAPAGGFTLACAPAWEAGNFARYASADPRAGLSARVRILRAETRSTCALTDTEAAAAGAVIETVRGTTHFLPIERPEIVRAALRTARRDAEKSTHASPVAKT
ncbi:MAG TPA: alpha/beta hydrolase [Acetobacteraceae bacterium]|nr:alpha/beta hydrolase [Acetobacteraceae bacterium]